MAFESIANVAGKLYGQIVKIPRQPTEDEQLVDSIRKARSDLERAESLFNETTSPEMIDCLSYDIMSAQARYSHLLKIARERNFENRSL
jgi:hypothetical protein